MKPKICRISKETIDFPLGTNFVARCVNIIWQSSFGFGNTTYPWVRFETDGVFLVVRPLFSVEGVPFSREVDRYILGTVLIQYDVPSSEEEYFAAIQERYAARIASKKPEKNTLRKGILEITPGKAQTQLVL